MACERFDSQNHNRSFIGTNLQVVDAAPACAELGFNKMLVSDCWGSGSAPPAPYPGWCLWPDETYTIVRVAPGYCPGCEDDNLHDCVNGRCEKAAKYGTPGKYATLAECQNGCAKECDGVCIPHEKSAELDTAVNAAEERLACK